MSLQRAARSTTRYAGLAALAVQEWTHPGAVAFVLGLDGACCTVDCPSSPTWRARSGRSLEWARPLLQHGQICDGSRPSRTDAAPVGVSEQRAAFLMRTGRLSYNTKVKRAITLTAWATHVCLHPAQMHEGPGGCTDSVLLNGLVTRTHSSKHTSSRHNINNSASFALQLTALLHFRKLAIEHVTTSVPRDLKRRINLTLSPSAGEAASRGAGVTACQNTSLLAL